MDRQTADTLNPDTPFLNDRVAQSLCAALESADHIALFVGGCVRNAVMGMPAADVDIATDAKPKEVSQLAVDAGFRAIPTGIDHGTVTVVRGQCTYEVTTFRRDVATDGRRAVVDFSRDVADDARRRDFTMNALYADRHGKIIDPLGGLEDARARRVRFIEDAGQRIREDYLRTLRFFRFHAQYAPADGGWDADALAGIAANLDGLETLSAERVGSEMIKLLAAPDPLGAVAVMEQTGVLARVLPGATTIFLGPLVHLECETGALIDPIARLAALGGQDVDARLRLSRKDRKQLDAIRTHSTSALGAKAIGYLAGENAGRGALLLRAAMANEPISAIVLEKAALGARADFPVKAGDLPDLKGVRLGKQLAELKNQWLDADLSLDKNQLLGP
jgi:poly(A) polymerase